MSELERRVAENEEKIAALEREMREREVRQLRWGVRVLGALTLALATYIWSQVGHIFNLGKGP